MLGQQLCLPTRLEPAAAGRKRAPARREAKTERDQEHAQKVDLLVPSEPGPQKGVSPTFLWEHLWIYTGFMRYPNI